MFDLRAISSLAPIQDLIFSLVIILMAAAVANLVIVPKLYRHSARSARVLLMITALGAATAIATLATQPRQIYAVILIYATVFMLAGFILAPRSIGWLHATVRVLAGCASMFLALIIAYWLTNSPR